MQTNLLFKDALLTVAGAGIGCHLIFNRLEPRKLPYLVLLLVVLPLSLTSIMVPFFSSQVVAGMATWALYLASLVTSTVIYRISPFHPLAKYPGPFICRVTKLYIAFRSMDGKQHILYQQLHRRYGDIVRVGPNEVTFCRPEAIAPMMGPGGMPKAEFWDGQFAAQTKWRSMIGLRHPPTHARLRRIWSRGFSPESLRFYHGLIDNRVNQLVEAMTKRAGQPVDLASWISWFAFDFMNDMAFGTGPELMLNEDRNKVWSLMENAQPTGLLMSHLPWSAEFYRCIPSFATSMKVFRDYSLSRVVKRYKEGSPNKDLFYHLIDEAALEASRPEFEQVASDASLAIVAGSDTIAPTLANIFWHLMLHPVAYKRVMEELDSNLNAEDESIVHALNAKLPYLDAVINETLRLFPPLLAGSTRAPLMGSGGQAIGDHFIREGTTVNVHSYTLHRDGRNFWPGPEEFIPERWLPEADQMALEPEVFKNRDQIVHNSAAFIPFSYGPMDCVGKKLAWHEMRLLVSGMLRKFHFEFAAGFDPSTWEENMYDYFVTKKGKLMVTAEAR